MLLIYLSGVFSTIIIGYLYNKHGNYWMQLHLGGVLVLSTLSWCGVLIQLLIGISQIEAKWFLPSKKRFNE